MYFHPTISLSFLISQNTCSFAIFALLRENFAPSRATCKNLCKKGNHVGSLIVSTTKLYAGTLRKRNRKIHYCPTKIGLKMAVIPF